MPQERARTLGSKGNKRKFEKLSFLPYTWERMSCKEYLGVAILERIFGKRYLGDDTWSGYQGERRFWRDYLWEDIWDVWKRLSR